MRNLTKRLLNKCRRELLKKTSWYDKKRKMLFKIIDNLEENDLSENLLENSITKKLENIGKNVILDNISMAYLPFIVYLLFLKYRGDIRLVPVTGDCLIKAAGDTIGRMSYLAAYIHFIEVKGNKLYIEGNISLPTVFNDRCSFGVKNNDKEVPCRLYDAGLDLKKGKNTYETRMVYRVEIPLVKEGNRIVFINYVDGNECAYGKINSMRFSPVADCIKYQYCVRDGWILHIEGNELCCEVATEEKIVQHEMKFQKELASAYPAKVEWAKSLRDEYFERIKHKKKPIWLFMDRIDRADDNAEVLYEYVKQYQNEIDSYFIIKKNTKDYDRLQPLGNIVEAYSREHFILVLLADYIISSQSNGVVENPFWDEAELFRDLYHQGKLVFLQHGVIKDDMSSTLARFNTNFTGFVTSAEREKQSILNCDYYYTEDKVWLTGLPRFDKLYNNPQKYVLLMPSWRQGLMEHVWDDKKQNMVWRVTADFTESEYVKRYSELMCNSRLKDACKKYGYKLAFMPHALMEPYIDRFVKSGHCVYWDSQKSYRDAFAEGNLLVTDYSSVAFDFAYLGKPVLYYQFDKEQFFAEHTYAEGYFDYSEDGFGEVVSEADELVKLIVRYLESDCKIKDEYGRRIDSFFKYRDGNCCKRVYNVLIKDGHIGNKE